jgi:hypothetical protein
MNSFLQGSPFHIFHLKFMEKVCFLFSPKSHILLKNGDISSFEVMVLVLWRMSVRMSTFGVVVLVCLHLFDSALPLHSNFAYPFQLLSVDLSSLLVLFEGHSVLL